MAMAADFNPNGLLMEPETKKETWRDRPRIDAPLVPSTPQIGGITRKHSNTMLIKPELGKVKQTTYKLPGAHHTYGKALYREDEGTGEMIMSWMEHEPNPHAKPGRDFKALNKGAVVAGATTAKQQLEFRKSHDARLKLGTHEERKFTLADGFVHGKATRCAPRVPKSALLTAALAPPARRARASRRLPRAAARGRLASPRRPSTPMNDLISSAYRWSWVAEHLEAERSMTAPTRKSINPAATKASRGHASTARLHGATAAAAQASPKVVRALSIAPRRARRQHSPTFGSRALHRAVTAPHPCAPAPLAAAQPFVMRRFKNVPAKVTSYMPPKASPIKPAADGLKERSAAAATSEVPSPPEADRQAPDPTE